MNEGTGTMAHTWDTKPDPKVEHVVTCTTCKVHVERVLEGGRWANYHVLPTLERKKGLAPKCETIVIDEERQAEFNATFVSAEGRKNPNRHPVYGWPVAGEREEETEIKISSDRNSDTELTPKSHELFMEFAEDARNWSGTPCTDGNVQMTNSQRGNLTHLKKVGLITTFEAEGAAWVEFTDKGIEYAGKNGVDLTWIKND